MREIKFRAWDEEGKRMYYQDEPLNGSNGFINVVSIYTGYDYADEWKYYIFMQYTGLKDKNGTEIYEGDIVKHHNDILSTVFYNTSHCAYLLQDISGNRNKCQFDKLGNYDSLWIEVIGNIFENQELLK